MSKSSIVSKRIKYVRGGLCMDGVRLDHLARKIGTPYYAYCEQDIIERFEELKSGLGDLPHLICYAVKANSNVHILKLLHRHGAGMDIVSGGELYRASVAGVPGKSIVFSGVGKTREEILACLMYQYGGIHSFNVESTEELQVLDKVAGEVQTKARVSLRFNPNVDSKSHPYIATGLKKNKFGMEKKEILPILKKHEKYRNLHFAGLSMHIGSQITSLRPFNDAFGRLSQLAGEANKLLGRPLSFLDIGGGIGVTYKSEKVPTLGQYTALIHKHFGVKSKLAGKTKVVLEPGRTLTANAGLLVSEVLYRKSRGAKDFLIVDAAMTEMLRPALYQSYHEIWPVKKTGGSRKKTDVVGPVCESADYLAQNRSLPLKISAGEYIAVLSAGAYGFTLASSYNSRLKPPEVLVKDGRFRVIRQRDGYEDLTRREPLPKI